MSRKSVRFKFAGKLSRMMLIMVLLISLLCGLTACRKKKTDPQEITHETNSSQPAQTQEIEPTGSASATYTVTFRDHNGNVIKTEVVEWGQPATAPDDPVRDGYYFAGWDKDFGNVTSDLEITATYTTTKPVISVESATVNKGADEVTLNIRVQNNPAIMGAVLKMSVDDKVFSFKECNKFWDPGLTLTGPGSGITSSPYTFLMDAMELSDEDKKDGILFSVTFDIKNPNATGDFAVKLSCDKGAIFDEDYNTPDVILENGTITIK